MVRSLSIAAALLALAPAVARADIKERVAAVVNGQPIALSEVREIASQDLARIDEQNPPDKAERRKAALRRGLDQLIDDKLIETEATNLGIDVSEQELDEKIDLLAKQNKMDLPAFKEALANQHIEFQVVRDSVRRQILQVRVLERQVKARTVSDAEVQAAYANLVANSDWELRVRHLYIPLGEGASLQQIAEAESKMHAALKRLDAGEPFALVARALSTGSSATEGGDLGWIRRGTLFPEADTQLFALKAGQRTASIRGGTPPGLHLFQVEDRRKAPPRPYDEVKEQLRNQLASESVLKERANYLQQLRKTAQIEIKL